MVTSFNNSPLVELIAELRWNVPGVPVSNSSAQTQMVVINNDQKLDEFFMRFGGAIYADGFQNVERLVPPNYSFLAFQPVCRFRKHAEAPYPALYQVGPGVFTANATPPYKTWNEFAPDIEKGVIALLSARANEDKDEAFFSTSLRYIDAFGPSLTQELEVGAFIQKILGIEISLPPALTKNVANGKVHKPFLQLQLPMENGMVMSVGIGEGLANGEKAIIMDTTVATTTPISANVDAVMNALLEERTVIHDMFFSITEPIKHLMQPTSSVKT